MVLSTSSSARTYDNLDACEVVRCSNLTTAAFLLEVGIKKKNQSLRYLTFDCSCIIMLVQECGRSGVCVPSSD